MVGEGRTIYSGTVMKFEELEQKLFEKMDMAEKEPYKFFNIHARVDKELEESLRNVRMVWKGRTTKKGTKVKLRASNESKMSKALALYTTFLIQAKQRIFDITVNEFETL